MGCSIGSILNLDTSARRVKKVSIRYHQAVADERRIHELIERLANLLRAEGRDTSVAGRRDPVHLQTLRYLSRANQYSDSPGALTEYLGTTKGTVSQSCNLLEREGLIERRTDPDDGRRVHLGLTPSGRRLVNSTSPPELLIGALADVESQIDEFEATLNAVLVAMQRQRGGRSFGVCNTCRFHEPAADGRALCGLTGESLTRSDTTKICREHQPATA